MNNKLSFVNPEDLFDVAKEADEIYNEYKFLQKYWFKWSNIIGEIYNKKKNTVNILTHCNAGWLATINWGTAAYRFTLHIKVFPYMYGSMKPDQEIKVQI